MFLLSGLLAWNLFSVALGQGARSVVDNANLVKKVSFPREILPLSVVGVALVDFVLQSSVLLLFILVTGYGFHVDALVLYPLAFAALLVFSVAMVFWLSALNVRYRDMPPDRPRAARVVLVDADRLPGRAGAAGS